jgi:hypothetical protein
MPQREWFAGISPASLRLCVIFHQCQGAGIAANGGIMGSGRLSSCSGGTADTPASDRPVPWETLRTLDVGHLAFGSLNPRVSSVENPAP